MGKFDISPEQKEELKHGDSTTPVPIEGASGQGKGTYHNPVTGREIQSLLDPYHLMLRLRQGWRLGPASPELREKWVVREAELRAEDDARVAEYVASQEHVDSEAARFNDAVTAAVTAVLDKLGVNLPDKSGAESGEPAPAPASEEPEGTQLSFDLPSDAPSESGLEHVVPQASRPELHLVD